MNLKEMFSRLSSSGRVWVLLSALALGVALLLLGGQGSTATARDGEGEAELYGYAAELEKKIASLCSQVEGVSHVTVAVSLEGGFEYVYATDSQGKVITVGSGSSSSGVIVKKKPPKLAGVGVVCSGGGDPETRQKLISLIGAAYGIGANRIFIT